ncbi:MAG: lytic transglycosylase domain-containing protein [Chromatiaceae bacterium]|jgi:soluble lytic murein transglycosylase-like protein|nr:lytic transglycosylase domain-containing protein [Chromatiaceae bacterium]
MRDVLRGVILLLLFLPVPSLADVYKYVDADGMIYFSDQPLTGTKYRLEWKRETKRVIEEKPRKVVAAGRRRLAPAPGPASARRAHYATLIESTARQFNLHPELLHAVVRTESAYNPSAVSSAGAVGLMQLMPATAARYGVSDIWDPGQNLRGGARYLRDLLNLFEHDLRLALAAYNAGEGAVIRHGRQIPPYPETQSYVRKVLQLLWAERGSAGS